MSETGDVVVVGGGVAGLSAARGLADAGLPVTLFEARPEIGGAARPGWLTGEGDRGFLAFLDATGTREDVLRPARGFHLGAHHRLRLAPAEGALPPHLWGTRLRLARLPRLLRTMRGCLCVESPERAARYDDRSVEEFGRLYLGPGAATEWLVPWLASRAPCDPLQTSRVAALLALSSRRDAGITALRRAPERRDPRWTAGFFLRCNAAVDRIEWDGGFRVWSGGRVQRARAVVLAVPMPQTRALGSELWGSAQRRALDAFREHTPETGWWRISEDRRPEKDAAGSAPLWSIRVAQSRSESVSSLCVDRGGGEVRAALRVGSEAPPEGLVRHIETLLPGFRLDVGSGRVETCARPRFDVGAYRALGRARRLLRELPGLSVAGEAWSESTLEGAALSGRRAARETLEALGLGPRAASP